MYEILVTTIFGILRWPVWTAGAYALFAVFVFLSLGYGWELPENLIRWDPIFTNAFRIIAMFSLAQCVFGYALGRLLGFARRWVYRKMKA